MKNKSFPIFIVTGLACVLLAAVFLANVEATPAVDYLVQDGIQLYKKGDTEKAIQQLSKVLILDPENQTAKEYLQKMGIDGGLYPSEKETSSSSMRDMTQKLREYKDQVSVLEEENFQKEQLAQRLEQDQADFRRAIDAKNAEGGSLRQELEQMQSEMAEQEARESAMRADVHKSLKESEFINANAQRLKGRIDRQLVLIDEKDQQIQQLQKRLRSSEKETRQKKLGYENEILGLKKEHRKAASQDWKEDVERDKNIEILRSRLRAGRTQISDLNDSLLLVNRKLASLEHRLLVKDNKISDLNRTMAEQREACPALMEKFPSKKKGTAPFLKMKKRALSPFSCPNAALFRKQDQRIANFKKRLAKAQREIASLRKNISGRSQNDVSVLKRQLADLEMALKKKDAKLVDEVASYDILEQRLNDAKERLDVANKMIQEKDEQIKDMEKQIGDIQGE